MTQVCNISWHEQQHPVIRQLSHQIEALWQRQLALQAYEIPNDLGYVEGLLEGERLMIENRCYQTAQFRKLHLELAKVGRHLDILHCVMFPHANFHLPIFGVDVVAGREFISAAIVDLSPVSPNHTLPAEYERSLQQLPVRNFAEPRKLPAWGTIFSKFCLFVRPATPAEETAFLSQAIQYLSIHCQLAVQARTVVSNQAQAAILAGQQQYCLQQRKNDKTRRILERAF
ncbi:MAG: phycocyanobilin:ferredoxin oxidoreductase, partial [Leptolyngbya sp. SIO4C1]|nr:phycocyanobilin:ferredoxin oxidoreductase [Leptolyngbya sp. SIO4C1]